MERTERPPQFQSVHYSFPQRFCHDPLWNSSVTWNTPDPDFTHCFQQTVLIWIPCVFLWLMLPWQAYILLSSHFNTRQWTLLSTAKIVRRLLTRQGVGGKRPLPTALPRFFFRSVDSALNLFLLFSGNTTSAENLSGLGDRPSTWLHP